MHYSEEHRQDMSRLYHSLSEKDRRRYAAIEARKLGHGGLRFVCHLFGCDPKTVRRGMRELQDEEALQQPGIRQPGGGRKPTDQTQPGIDDAFHAVLTDYTAGDPMDGKVKWTSLEKTAIAKALKKRLHHQP